MSTELVVPSNHLILCRPLLLPSVFPSITIFSLPNNLHTLSHLIFYQFYLYTTTTKISFFSFYSNKHIVFVIYQVLSKYSTYMLPILRSGNRHGRFRSLHRQLHQCSNLRSLTLDPLFFNYHSILPLAIKQRNIMLSFLFSF